MKVTDFIPELVIALRNQLTEDEKRHGDTWLKRERTGQEVRIFSRFDTYYKDWIYTKTPIPWLKVIGLAFIAWIREQHSEIWNK